MTGWLVLAGIALVVGYCALIFLVQLFGEWAVNREAERTANVPGEAAIAENEMCALLDEARDHVEGLFFAAEIAELEETG